MRAGAWRVLGPLDRMGMLLLRWIPMLGLYYVHWYSYPLELMSFTACSLNGPHHTGHNQPRFVSGPAATATEEIKSFVSKMTPSFSAYALLT